MTTTLVFNAVPLAKLIRDNIVAAATPLLIANWFGVSEHLKRPVTYFLNTNEADSAARSTTDAEQHHALSELGLHYAA